MFLSTIICLIEIDYKFCKFGKKDYIIDSIIHTIMNLTNLERDESLRDASWWCFFKEDQNSREYIIWWLWLWRLAVDCNPCIQWAIETETDYTCWWDFWLYLNWKRAEYSDIPELYDYQKELITIWWRCDVPIIWNHAYKFNMEKHTVWSVITYPRFNEKWEIARIWIWNWLVIKCKWWKLTQTNWYSHWKNKLLDFYNDNDFWMRTLYKNRSSSKVDCWTSTIKTIWDRYIQDATMSNMFIHYLENNWLHWITYLLKTAKEANIHPKMMKKKVDWFLKWLKWPKNSWKKLASWLVRDVKYPPSSDANIVDEQTRARIEDWMLKPFRMPKELLWATSEHWWYSKYLWLERIYEKTWWIKSRWLYNRTVTAFNKKFRDNLRYPELSLYDFRCEREVSIDLEHSLQELKCQAITVDEYRELIWREPLQEQQQIGTGSDDDE